MPEGNTVASAYVQIVPSAKGIKGGIGEALGGDAGDAGKSIGSQLVGSIKGVIAAAGIGALLGKTLTEGAALEQSIGGVETLFKDSADTIKQYAAEAYTTAGVSANSYMEQVTSFSATLLDGLGGDTAAAAESANKAIEQMADNANKMGTDIGSIQYAYQGFAKDNYTMLDNLKLGYGGTQSEMARLINDSGVLGDTVKVTAETVKDVPFDKVIDAIGVIQDKLEITGTTANEAATTLSGSFASMQAAATNVLGALTLGQDIQPALNGLATSVTTFLVGNLLPAVWNILSALPGALVTFIQSLAPQLLTALQGLVPQIMASFTQAGPQMTTAAQTMLTNFQTAVTTYLPNLLNSGVQMVQQIVTGIVTGLPSLLESVTSIGSQFVTTLMSAFSQVSSAAAQIVPTISTGVLQSLPSLISTAGTLITSFVSSLLSQLPSILESGGQMLMSIIQGIVQNLPEIVNTAFSTVMQFLQGILTHLPDLLEAGISLIGELIAGLIGAIPDVIASIPSIISGIVDTFLSFDWLGLGVDLIGGIINGILSAAGSIVDAIVGVASDAFNAAKEFFGIASPSKLMRREVGPYIPEGWALGIEDNADLVRDAMDDLAAIPTQRMVGTLKSTAANPPQMVQAPAQQGGISFEQMQALFAALISVIRETSGDVVIGDDVIYRAYNRARQSQAIVTGGAVF